MTTPLRISEARKRLSQLLERVARRGAPVAIGRYGRERALLVSAEKVPTTENFHRNRRRRSRALILWSAVQKI
jgi:prevent-host-death family protein